MYQVCTCSTLHHIFNLISLDYEITIELIMTIPVILDTINHFDFGFVTSAATVEHAAQKILCNDVPHPR